MSDAITEGYRMAEEGKAEDAFHEALILYLHHPTPATTAMVREKMQTLADTYRSNSALESIDKIFKEYDDNNKDRWRYFIKHEGQNFFIKYPELKKLFYEAAKKRGIGEESWVIE